MKRLLALLLATSALAVMAAVIAGVSRAGSGDSAGPACTDLNGATFNYATASVTGTYTLGAQLFLGPNGSSGPCKNIDYTLYVITGSSQSDPIPVVGSADPQGNLLFGPTTISDTDGSICVFGTSARNGRVLDRAPDSGCLQLNAGGTGGNVGFG
jgi:hypothetical protein